MSDLIPLADRKRHYRRLLDFYKFSLTYDKQVGNSYLTKARGFCWNLGTLLQVDGYGQWAVADVYNSLTTIYPELLPYRPRDAKRDQHWIPIDTAKPNHSIRIRILEEILKTIDNENK